MATGYEDLIPAKASTGYEDLIPSAPAAIPSSGVPGPRRAPSAAQSLGRAAASLADVTLGGVLPAAVQTIGYPVLRAFSTPEQAAAGTQRMVQQIDQPFGKLFGVAQTPEYQEEASRRLMDFIGQNIQKGAAWISGQTGVPQTDVENMMATATLAAPKAVAGGAKTVRAAAETPLGQDIRAGLQLPLEPTLQARRERLSAESYAKGPQLDAAKEAQRLGLALNPVDIQPTVGPRVKSALAGARGEEALQQANRPQVNAIGRRDMGMPDTAQLNSPKTFDAARATVAAPYEQIKKIPVIQADDAARAALDRLRPAETMIGGEASAAKINSLIDSALTQVDAGMSGQAFLDNVSKLRKDARRIYRNKNAGPAEIDIAETNLAVANVLEGMIEKSVFDPRLLADYRAAREKMARIYAYEAATDLNTGFIDPAKIARITAKDNTLTGDLAAIGRIAGNFPTAFAPAPGAPWYTSKISRSGFGGAGGGIAGAAAGGLEGALVGGAIGGLLGEAGSRFMARNIASPEYQAGLRVPDFRLPVNQLASEAPAAPANALMPYVAPQSVLIPGEGAFVTGAAPSLRRTSEGVFVAPPPPPGPQRSPQAQFVGPAPTPPGLPAPSAEATMATLRAEDARRAGVSRAIGKEAEARQAAAEAAARRPAGGEVILDFDPVTGRFREASQGLKGATPDILEATGKAAVTAAEKARTNQFFRMSAEEKIQWGKSMLEGMPVTPGETQFRKLTPDQILNKIADRQGAADFIKKARDEAEAFTTLASRQKDARARREILIKREQMLDMLDALEEQLRAPRPVELGGQGPKTRAAQRNRLAPQSENVNALAP